MPPDLMPVDYDPFADASGIFPAFDAAAAAKPIGINIDPLTGVPIPDNVEQSPAWMKKLIGAGGEARHMLWPEQMVRRGADIVHSAWEGNNQLESKLGVPGAAEAGSQDVQYTPNMLGRALGMTQPWYGPGSESGIAKVQDLSGLMAGGPLIERPGAATLGSGAVRHGAVELPKAADTAPPFYSAVEAAVRDAPQGTMSPEQWRGYLSNRPGVKAEELDWTGLPEGKKVTKQEMLDHVQEHGVQVKEVNKKGGPDYGQDDEVAARGQAYNEVRAQEPQRANETHEDWFGRVEDRIEDRAYELMEGQSEGGPKFSEYQLPGGENYREKLFTLPTQKRAFDDLTPAQKTALKAQYERDFGEGALEGEGDLREYHDQYQAKDQGASYYKSSHWDEPNVLAHVRMNDRYIPDDKSGTTNLSLRSDEPNGFPTGINKPLKTLHLEELQSDWHQAGRKEGYKTQPSAEENAIRERIKNNTASEADYAAWESTVGDKFKRETNTQLVPDAPFKTTWPDLVLKRMIREAAENGYDAISWTPGEAQAARYDLSKQVDNISVKPPIGSSDRHVAVNAKSGVHASALVNAEGKITKGYDAFRDAEGKHLSDVIGKEMAERILKADKETKFEGLDLKVGGEGMKGFYDKILVDKANALAKKFGGKVEYKEIPTHETNKDPAVTDQLHDRAVEAVQAEFERRTTDKNWSRSTREQKFEEFAEGAEGEKIYNDVIFKGEPVKMKIPVLRLTPQMRDTALRKGFPLFSAGVPFPLEPVDHDPFKGQDK